MKKILLLGGSAQQIVAIETAKKLGYYTVLCDFLEDNPGQQHADRFYLVSTTDKDAVLKVATEEKVDGILAYASDPAAPTAAYVAERLGLPGNPFWAVDTLCNKDKFRKFLHENGFNAPLSRGYARKEAALAEKELFELPIIVKPVDSSGSKGVTVLRTWDDFGDAVDFAFSFSRAHRIIVEEFVEKKHKYLIGGDIFVSNGRVILWGLLNCHRDLKVNPLVPVGKSYPLLLDAGDVIAVKQTLERMIQKLGIQFGSMNVELVVDKDSRVWPIDIGPRAGGNMIPDLLGMIYNADVVRMAVQAAMGEPIRENNLIGSGFYATHNLHSEKTGSFGGVSYSKELCPKIVREVLYKKPGDHVEYFDNAAKAIGIVFMKFDSLREMDRILENIGEHIVIHVEENR